MTPDMTPTSSTRKLGVPGSPSRSLGARDTGARAGFVPGIYSGTKYPLVNGTQRPRLDGVNRGGWYCNPRWWLGTTHRDHHKDKQ